MSDFPKATENHGAKKGKLKQKYGEKSSKKKIKMNKLAAAIIQTILWPIGAQQQQQQ